jgi:hypothetical protein
MSATTNTPGQGLAGTAALRAQLEAALWQITPAQRVAAMWRRELSPYQLQRWSARAPDEVPLLGREYAYIVMDTPEWAETGPRHRDNVAQLPQRTEHRAAA